MDYSPKCDPICIKILLVMHYKVMHHIYQGLRCSLKILEILKMIFWLIQRGFLFTPSYLHNRGKFHQYSICGCQVKNFQSFSYRFSIHEIAPFLRDGGGLGPYSPKYGPTLLKFLPEVVYKQTKSVF